MFEIYQKHYTLRVNGYKIWSYKALHFGAKDDKQTVCRWSDFDSFAGFAESNIPAAYTTYSRLFNRTSLFILDDKITDNKKFVFAELETTYVALDPDMCTMNEVLKQMSVNDFVKLINTKQMENNNERQIH